MTQPTALLFAGALDHLMRHHLTGCRHAAQHAASLLERLSARPDVDGETQCLCERMSESLAVEGARSNVRQDPTSGT